MSIEETELNNARWRNSIIRRLGIKSWMILGMVALGSVVYSALASLSGLVVPLILATVMGILAVPLVDRIERLGVHRYLGSALVLLGLTALIFGSFVIAVNGIIEQGDEISEQIAAGYDVIIRWVADLDVELTGSTETVEQGKQIGQNLLPGLATFFTSAFSSAISFFMGSFIAAFLLYFILVDWELLRNWVAGHLGVPVDLGQSVIDDATFAIRQGFYALSISSIVTAVIIGVGMVILGVPLAFTVALVTFVTSYIPYLGAIFSGIFAFVVALGSGGLTVALILLAIVLITQNLVQTVVQTKLQSDRLALHPIASLGSTIVGASLAGILGATLSAPILAMSITIGKRLREHTESQAVSAEQE